MNWFKKKEMPEVPTPVDMQESIELPDVDLPSLDLEPLPELPPLPNFNEPINLEPTKKKINPKIESQKIMEQVEENIENIPKEKFVDKINYETAMKLIGEFDGAIKNSQGILDSLIELKTNADHKLEEWRTILEDAERKLVYADRVMFE